MKILVSGAGIAGATFAHWAARAGHEPILVEKAPAPRRGGYAIDFWGAGFDVAERMGIDQALYEHAFDIESVEQINERGRSIGVIKPQAIVAGASERYVTVTRSDLADIIMGSVDEAAETMYGDEIDELEQHADGVRVRLAGGRELDVDLVVGADGLHSRVRELVFGPESDYAHDQGIVVSAIELEDFEFPSAPSTVTMYTEVGVNVVQLGLADGATLVMFTMAHSGELPRDTEGQKAFLASTLAGCSWHVPAMLDALGSARSFYLDSASQIRMPSWASGRVALIGDAASSPSLLAGQGSALAMVQAYVLAASLGSHGNDIPAALTEYERSLGDFIRGKQKAAGGLAIVFAPRTRWHLALRNLGVRIARIPAVSRRIFAPALRDAYSLPDFPVRDAASPN